MIKVHSIHTGEKGDDLDEKSGYYGERIALKAQ